MNITIPPIPAKIPSAIKSVNTPGGNEFSTYSVALAKEFSINSIGYALHTYIAWKIVSKMRKKITYPKTL